MCDTMVALPSYTADRSVLFAKNSDRSPNEPHQLIFIPHKTHTEAELRATYRSIPQVTETNAVLLLKPSWLWGCEMGVNEHGLTIGNEAVFTRFKAEAPTLIGMDYVRLALERCQTAAEGVKLICALLEQYGQGGNCGFDKPFTYDNSYLLANKTEAWVLETAGRFWSAKRIRRGCAAISNRLSLENDYDEIHPGAIAHALQKGWCKTEENFRFAATFADPLYSKFAKGHQRRTCALALMEKNAGRLTPTHMKSILRSHDDRLDKAPPLAQNSVGSICMHAGGAIGDHTTGAFVAQLLPDDMRLWATGASTPCFSTFKPIAFGTGGPVFDEANSAESTQYWRERELLFRSALSGHIDLAAYLPAKTKLELDFDSLTGTPQEVAAAAHKAEQAFVVQAEESFKTPAAKPLGNLFYRLFWQNKTKAL